MAPTDDPVRDGRFWLFPDGTRLPVISGGATDDGGDDGDDTGGDDDGGDDTGGGGTVAEVEQLRAALKRANKEAEERRRKLKQYEDAEKSDSEKLAEATKRAEAAELRALRLEIAHRKGLTPAQAKRLVGSTEEELEADADELLDAFGSAAGDDDGKPPPPARKPVEQLRGGGQLPDEPEEMDPAKLAAKIPRY